MDLTQSVRTLQGMQLEGDRRQLQAPLNPMDLRRLQNGMLGRSSSVMDLPHRSSSCMDLPQGLKQDIANQFQLSGSAMLVGTVAALQEESGQLRSQWKSDVGRLERELDQLRMAAAYALPHLAEVQKQPDIRTETNLQALVLAGLGGTGSLQQTGNFGGTGSFALPNAGNQFHDMQNDRHSPLAQIAEREQLLERIMDLESQRKNMELQRDQALFSQMRCGSAASDCRSESGYQEAMMTERSFPTRTSSSPHLDTSQQLTEALLCQMRNGVGEAAQRGYGLSEAPPPAPTTLDVLAEQQQRIQDLQNAVNGGGPGPAPSAAWGSSAPQAEMTPAEVYMELERMEIELQKVRDENGRLKEEKAACEEAHARDVSTLEAMLSQIMNDNQRLTKALNEAEAQVRTPTKVNPMGNLDDKQGDLQGADHSVRSIRSVMEPASEPDMDRWSDCDRRRSVS